MTKQDHDGRTTSWRRRLVVGVVVGALATPLAAYAADRFTDVPNSNIFHDDIAWLADAGVTKGCNPPDNTRFCPSDEVTREQMAAFLRRLAENQVVDAAKLDGNDLNEVRYPSVLPAGETVVGHYGVDDQAGAAAEDFGANIDFGIDVGAAPTAVYVPVGGSDANCTGSTSAPTAPPGYLCVYEEYATNTSGAGAFLDLTTEPSARFGNLVYVTATGAGDVFAAGTWAVTAPTGAPFTLPGDSANAGGKR